MGIGISKTTNSLRHCPRSCKPNPKLTTLLLITTYSYVYFTHLLQSTCSHSHCRGWYLMDRHVHYQAGVLLLRQETEIASHVTLPRWRLCWFDWLPAIRALSSISILGADPETKTAEISLLQFSFLQDSCRCQCQLFAELYRAYVTEMKRYRWITIDRSR